MSEDEKRWIKEAILSAKSLEEVEMLQQQLQMGNYLFFRSCFYLFL